MCTMSDLSHPSQGTQGIITFIACETRIEELAQGLRYAWNINAKTQATGIHHINFVADCTLWFTRQVLIGDVLKISRCCDYVSLL